MIKITSLSNDKIKYLQSLKDKKQRYSEQKYLIEGYHLVEEAYQAQLLETIITTDEKINSHFKDIDVIIVNDKIINLLATTTNPQNILGVVKMVNYDLDSLKITNNFKAILLDDINDPGNLGTIIRTAGALGYQMIFLSKTCVDLYNEKVLRATQGVIYKIPIIRTDLLDVIKMLKKHHIKTYVTSLDEDTKLLEEIKFADKFALCFGNEAHGVSKEVLDSADAKIKIMMQNGVESLNVAICAGIIMYELKNK